MCFSYGSVVTVPASSKDGGGMEGGGRKGVADSISDAACGRGLWRRLKLKVWLMRLDKGIVRTGLIGDVMRCHRCVLSVVVGVASCS